jgi:enamine deaminase RidA (YjgF/YER057c/UK114 family)
MRESDTCWARNPCHHFWNVFPYKSCNVQTPSVEDLAASFADSTRHALGHAQTSLETAQQNWSSLLAGTSKWADSAGIAPRYRRPSPLESAFGELWNDAMPRLNPFRVRASAEVVISLATCPAVCLPRPPVRTFKSPSIDLLFTPAYFALLTSPTLLPAEFQTSPWH